ncbi:YolD-like family protein [Faecalicoccus pleomorphus]|uniref:YolD-like family protein n=1 Tax=Faecalicoccus pleomorphus TaxID=1323 RepID=UPI00232E8FD9|nr:YolD-like family protein [Faecalicoccus pleomorphus]MDB7987078.1 YolD-like family protein [Faecalicoccus pleomorphus]MDB7992096.1 YolD-like family protein [Faecalicoccus pleomorphus]
MMDKIQRAHIFSAFDALKGFREMLKEQERVIVPKRMLSEDDLDILNQKIHAVEKGMMVTLTYFDNGDYVKQTGRVAKISFDENYIQIVKTKIPLKSIVDIQCEELEIYDF